MTICDKIQTVGNTLEENLNERGIQCTFGKGNGKSTIYDMVRLVNDTNFKGSSDVNLNISANRPYLLVDETTDVVVKLEDGLCEPLKNKNVTIEQSLFKDNGTSTNHNDHWYINDYGTATVQSDGTKLLNTSGNGNFVMRSIIPSNKTITESNAYSYNPPFVVEFDIVETNGASSSNAQVQIYSSQTTNNFTQELTTGHYKIAVTSEEQKIWVDDTLIKTTNLSLPNARITLRIKNSKYLIYKNFKVYKIINGVTDGKGEFALYDVSVTDDTTFTATYGTETASCLVEYCTYVNYLVDNEHDANSYYGTGTVIYDKSGATLDATTFSSSNYQLNFIPIDDVVTVPYEVKFELLDNDTTNFRVYFYNTNFGGSAIASGTFYRQNQQPTLIRFVVTSSGITRYVGNTSTALTVGTSIASEVGARFGYWKPTKGKVKIRNFRIKSL